MSCSVLHCDETATVNPLPVDSLSIAKKRIHRSVCVCMSAGCCVTVAAYICVWMYVFIIEEHAWLCVCEMEKERLHVCACACLCLPLNMRVYLCLYVCVCECWGEVVCAIAAKQLSANQYSQASVSGCQEWSENSAKLLQTLFRAEMLRFGCRLQFKETTCKMELLLSVASGYEYTDKKYKMQFFSKSNPGHTVWFVQNEDMHLKWPT